MYCCVVLDVFSRRVLGWSIDSHQATPWSPTPSAWHHRPQPATGSDGHQ
jgi:transposase InsO family protein